MRIRNVISVGVVLTVGLGGSVAAAAPVHRAHHAWHHLRQAAGPDRLGRVGHVVVVYEENHSFDNLYGGWEGVNGVAGADAPHTTQVGQAGVPYACLKQNDASLSTPPLSAACHDATTGTAFDSHFFNAPFTIDQFIPPTATTCPNGTPGGAPGGCTRDLVHRFYQEQYQINGGRQNRYTTGSDAIGLTQGVYDTRTLPIYRYLHGEDHPHYAIADAFFQGAFGGSFLNHQWLIAARTPQWSGAPAAQHSAVDANGMPTSYPLYTAAGTVSDKALTAPCPAGQSSLPAQPSAPAGQLCGEYAVNTIQPTPQPHAGGAQLPLLTNPTIGDRLTAKDVDWAWYSGGWSNADGDVGAPGWTNGRGTSCTDPATAAGSVYPHCPNALFQYHHQPFNYFADYAPGTAARTRHLRDEAEFLGLAKDSSTDCALKPVSFIKPVGAENEHPGYASESQGSDHLVDLLKAVEGSACSKDTMVVVTYDEFGGAWDHVPPPGQAGGPAGPHDQSGPGTRIPALILSPGLRGNEVVDSASHDTTSILATIEHRWGLAPLSSRDAAVNDLSTVYNAHQVTGQDQNPGS